MAFRVIIDVESTGLSTRFDRIVSVAASTWDGHEYFSFVNPGVRIPPASTAVHGITDSRVKDCRGWARVGAELSAWIESVSGCAPVQVIAHNARYDTSIIRAENARHSVRFVNFSVIDTLAVCRAALPGLASHRQAAVYEHLFGVEPGGQHSALDDVRALRKICASEKIAPALKNRQIDTFFVKKTIKRCKQCLVTHSTFFRHVCL